MYRSVFKFAYDEFIEKKSRFIGYAKPVKTEEEALDFINEIKRKNKDATHNCHAYIIGRNMLTQRFSDDGEPSGTAGIPMLEVLKKENLTNTAVVVTRYFGGILLGAGGLVRAYTKGAKIAVDRAIKVEIENYKNVLATFDYTHQGKIMNYLNINEVEIADIKYTDKITLDLILNKNENKVKSDLMEITSANIEFIEGKAIFLPTVNGKIFKGEL